MNLSKSRQSCRFVVTFLRGNVEVDNSVAHLSICNYYYCIQAFELMLQGVKFKPKVLTFKDLIHK